jgi:alpha-L-fucosidase
MKLHAPAIYGCTQSEFPAPPDCRITQRGGRLYVHIFAWPFEQLHLDDFAGKIEYAQLLNDASEVRFAEKEGTLTLRLPVRKPDVVVPVVELFLREGAGA